MNQRKTSIERREFLKLGAISAFGLVVTAGDLLWRVEQVRAAELSATNPQPLSPDLALQKLMEGNRRFVTHLPRHPKQSEARLHEVAQAQHPFATILSCADSRVPAEIVFDRGIGDIFDVRVAGNIVTPEVMGSIEYAVVLLETPVLMVLGHERCGAVTAAVKEESLPNSQVDTFVKAIKPALDKVKDRSGDAVDNAVIANVEYQIEKLEQSPLLTERMQSGKLKIVGGRYDLDTGEVKLLT
ncbi:carbonic anhydrase [Pleurocapsales cyanobacterium LEGE 06147]|nr:carbonic anhydrase [Pleurocapsales cyanobacterium LEGE 06147]